MVFAAASSIDLRLVLIGAVVAALLLTLAGLAVRGWLRRRRQPQPQPQSPPIAPLQAVSMPEPAAGTRALDGAALHAAVAEAEAEGASQRLPGLYLSLAQWQLESGETRSAEDLLRKCLRSTATKELKETHAKARVVLGDIAQGAGDAATACEHWQIARNLFHELRQRGAYDAVDARMLRNGCPTDWVLTDF